MYSMPRDSAPSSAWCNDAGAQVRTGRPLGKAANVHREKPQQRRQQQKHERYDQRGARLPAQVAADARRLIFIHGPFLENPTLVRSS
jgi:hypothetical protein